MTFFQLDVFDAPIPNGYDIITCSLFLHHLDEEQAIAVLRKMRDAAGQLALVNDLRRCRSGWLLACAGVRILTRSPTVHVDAQLSVEGAFTPQEALALAHRAGWDGATRAPQVSISLSNVVETAVSIGPTLSAVEAANTMWDVSCHRRRTSRRDGRA